MKIGEWTVKASKKFYKITNPVVWIGYVGVVAIILLVFVDVFGRYLLGKPFIGAYELVEQVMILVGGSAIMYAVITKGHVAIDLLFTRFSKPVQVLLQNIFSFLGFGVWAVLAYGVYINMLRVMSASETTTVLGISLVPFLIILALAMFLSSLASLIQTLSPEVAEENSMKEGVIT